MDWEEQPPQQPHQPDDAMEVEEGGEEEEHGAEEDDDDDEMNVDDMPVTQEDAWAVIRYGNSYFEAKGGVTTRPVPRAARRASRNLNHPVALSPLTLLHSAYFEEKGLVRQQLDSFDEFIQNTMQELVDDSGDIRVSPEIQHLVGYDDEAYDKDQEKDTKLVFEIHFGQIYLSKVREWKPGGPMGCAFRTQASHVVERRVFANSCKCLCSPRRWKKMGLSPTCSHTKLDCGI